MSKPSIAELLTRSGNTTFTSDLVTRAIKTLYGQIGAGLDERNWTTILATSNALASAESALTAMYQSADFLLRNANHLVARGYNEHQIELTYRQIYTDLGVSYSPRWALNTAFQPTSELTLAQLLAATSAANLPVPTITFAATPTGFTVTLSEAGSVIMSVSGNVGNYAAGTSVLVEANAVSSGFLTVTGGTSNKTSTATTDFVTLGTTGNDTIDTTAAGTRVDYIFGGAGQDNITSGDGADSVLGGAGGDTLIGGAGNDTLIGGTGWDELSGGAGTDYLYLNSGDTEFERVSLNISTDGFDVIDGFHFGGGLGGFGFDRMDLTAPTGLGLIQGAASSLTNNINGGNGTSGQLAADTAGTAGNTLFTIAGADQLGAGTTTANAVTRAVTELSDGADFLGNTNAANQGALVLLTDDGTSHYLFLVVDANNNHVTNAGEVTLVAVLTNSTNLGNITMVDFNI